MSGEKKLVITAYGHDAIIDQIAVSDFDGFYGDAKIYLDTINSLELRGNSWVFAQIISSAARYAPAFLLPPPPPMKFDVIMKLDDQAIQKILREIDAQELVKALKGAAEPIKEKIFNCMDERAVQMLKEDIEFLGPVRLRDVEAARERILNIIRHLEANGDNGKGTGITPEDPQELLMSNYRRLIAAAEKRNPEKERQVWEEMARAILPEVEAMRETLDNIMDKEKNE